MEIDEKKLKEILTEQRREFERFSKGEREESQRFVENKFEQQREEFQRFAENKFEQQREESQRYLGILKEDFESKVQLIGEQYQDIKETLASHTDMLGALAEDVADIKNTLSRKVDREEFLGHEKRISVLERSAGDRV